MATFEFPIAASADDGMTNGSGAVYATQTTDGNFTGEVTDLVLRRLDAATYRTRVAMLRWDTSSIVGAEIVSATLRLFCTARFNVDSLSFMAEWYAYDGSPSAADFTVTPSGTAHAGTALSALTLSADNDFALQNLGSIFTGPTVYTGLRLHVSESSPGTPPTGHNQLSYSSFDHASNEGPRLIVETQEGGGLAWIRA